MISDIQTTVLLNVNPLCQFGTLLKKYSQKLTNSPRLEIRFGGPKQAFQNVDKDQGKCCTLKIKLAVEMQKEWSDVGRFSIITIAFLGLIGLFKKVWRSFQKYEGYSTKADLLQNVSITHQNFKIHLIWTAIFITITVYGPSMKKPFLLVQFKFSANYIE